MHNGFLQVEGEKMSKSLGNFVTINELLNTDKFGCRKWPGNALRLAMIDTHYRRPINWTIDKLNQAEFELFRFASGMIALSANCFNNNLSQFSDFILGSSRDAPAAFVSLLDDDLNTPAALAYIRQRYARMDKDPQTAIEVLNALEFLGIVRRELMLLNQPPGTLRIFDRDELEIAHHLGRELTVGLRNNNSKVVEAASLALKQRSIDPRPFVFGMFVLEKVETGVAASEERIKELVSARLEARKRKDFAESDRIRDELAKMGISLKDTKNKETGEIETTWEVTR
jgi:cysteinyl-tRNA synthetase